MRENGDVATNPTIDEVRNAISLSTNDPEVRDLLAAAIRTSLVWFASLHPGRAVELRVPPFKAVQILGGTTHRRGTPPAIVEMGPATWLALLDGKLDWAQGVADGRIQASGERSDLEQLIKDASKLL